MLNKKGIGIVTSITLSIIIGAIVLGIMAGLILPKQFPKAAQALGIIGGKIKEAVTKEEFVPYEDQLTDDERKIDDSMKALMCALSSTSKGKLDESYCIDELNGQKPSEKNKITGKATSESKVKCNGILYGTICVECTDPEGNMPTGNFVMYQHSPPKAKKQFNCKVLGFELPQEIAPYSAEAYIKGLGDPKYLAYYEQFPEGEEKSWQFEAKTMVFVGLGVRTVFALIPLAGDIMKLPKLGSLIKGHRLRKIAKLADGLDQLDEIQKAKRLKKIGKILDQLSDNEKYLMEGFETLIKAGQSRSGVYALLNNEAADDIAFRIMGKIDDAKQAARAAGHEYLDTAQQTIIRNELKAAFNDYGVEPILPQNYGQLYNKAMKNEFKTADDVKNWLMTKGTGNIDDFVLKGSPTKLAEIGKKMTFKKMLPQMMMSEGKFSSKTLQKTMQKSITGLKSLKSTNPKLYDDAIKEAEKLADGFVDSQGRIHFEGFMGRASKNDEVLETLFKTVDEAKDYGVQVESMKDLLKGRTIGKGAYKGTISQTVGPLPSGTSWGQMRDILSSLSKGTGCIHPITKKPITNCLTFIKDHYLPIMIGLGFISAQYDKEMRKFEPMGKNSVGVLFGEEISTIKKKDYETPALDQYYLIMQKEDNSRNRFFAASPCKTDYTTKRGYCTCEMSHLGFVYNLEEGNLQPIKKPEITDISHIKPIYVWDELTPKNKAKFLLEHNFFRKQSGDLPSVNRYIREQQIHNGLARIRWALEDDEDLMEEYHNTMFKNPDEYLAMLNYMPKWYKVDVKKFGLPNKNNAKELLGKFENVIKIKDFNEEEFRRFQRALIEFYIEAETHDCSSLLDIYTQHEKYCYDPFTYEYEKNGKKDSINIPELWYVLDPVKGFVLFPVGILRYDKSKRHELFVQLGNHQEINVGFFWVNEDAAKKLSFSTNIDGGDYIAEKVSKEISVNPFWQDIQVSWQNRKINFNKLYADQKEVWETFPKMMTYRFYRSEFFDERARQAAYRYYIYSGPIDDIIKKCPEEELFDNPPNLNDVNGKFLQTARIPCLTVVPDMDSYKTYNNGFNYCYSAKSLGLKITEDIFTWASIAGSVIVSVYTGNPAVVAAAYVADLGSIAASFVLQLCGDWPRHSAGLSGCLS